MRPTSRRSASHRPLRAAAILAAFCVSTTLSFCAAPPHPASGGVPAEAGEFLFEVESVSFAWGARRSGAYVDREGNVWRYEAADPRSGGERDAWSASELRARYAQGRERIGAVPPEQVARMSALVADAARGALTDPVSRCRDAGVVSYRAWRRDPETGLYRPVLLRQEGDVARANRSGAAAELVEWLRAATGERGVPPCAP